MRVNVRLPMRHRPARKINKWNRPGECVVEKECGLIRIEFVRQHAARLQIGDLTGGKRNQFAYAFMESRRRPKPQQVRNLRPRVSLEVIAMPELMMRSEKPSRIRFDAL